MKITKTFFKQNFPKIAKNSYKNINGKVLIIAGSKTMQGAAVLNVLGAYFCGAGMVALASVPEVIKAAVCTVPQVLVLPLEKQPLLQIKKYIKEFNPDVIVIGSGLSALAKDTLNILKCAKVPAVIDASSLTYLASQGCKLPKGVQYILTPHIGEMKRLLKQKTLNIKTAAKELAQKTGTVCLLKGPVTYISDGTETYESHAGNCGLAKAGSGDVLAGIIGAIYARLLTRIKDKKSAAFLAAALGCYLHGFAADLAAKETGKTSLLATDVLHKIPAAIKNLLK